MAELWRFKKALTHQLNNLQLALSRQQVQFPPLGSATLDYDDVQIARNWLKLPELRQNWDQITLVESYQQQFSQWNGSQHAFAFMGGRVALSAAIYALNLKPGDEVIVPGYTCIVVPNALKFVGVQPVYCDIELDTYGLDVNKIGGLITPRTKAILLHHLYGLVCRDYDLLLELAQKHSLPVIEDCAHATGAEYHDKKIGNLGTIAFYSSEQSKIFNTIQGGIATTNDNEIAQRLTTYWSSAHLPEHEFTEKLLYNVILRYYSDKHRLRWVLGDIADIMHGNKTLISTNSEEMKGIMPAHYGARMPAPIAALGINQLKKIDTYNEQRRATAKQWDQWCLDHSYQPPHVIAGSTPVYLRYPVLVEPQMKTNHAWTKKSLGIKAGVWFTSHQHPAPCHFPELPQACRAISSCINLPTLLS